MDSFCECGSIVCGSPWLAQRRVCAKAPGEHARAAASSVPVPLALSLSDRGYVLENGRIVMEDECAALREKADIREFYLGIQEAGARGERRWKKKKTWR